jgi:hypothetical protein
MTNHTGQPLASSTGAYFRRSRAARLSCASLYWPMTLFLAICFTVSAEAQECAASLGVTGPTAGNVTIHTTDTVCGVEGNHWWIVWDGNPDSHLVDQGHDCYGYQQPNNTCVVDDIVIVCGWRAGSYTVGYEAQCEHTVNGVCTVDSPVFHFEKKFTIAPSPGITVSAQYRPAMHDILIDYDYQCCFYTPR